jgi:succinyl-CoA synthetase beta subunit
MDLFEYQGKQLFGAGGIPVARSTMVHPQGPDPLEVVGALGLPLVVKAQVLTGGRGKAGGVRVARTRDDLTRDVAEIMAMTIRGKRVVGVLLEEAVDIDRELYLALAVDRAAKRPLLLFSVRGGVDIEAVARDEPQALVRQHIDPLAGLHDTQIAELVERAGFAGGLAEQFAALVGGLWRLFCAHDATLVEINPLVVTRGGRLIALDAKVTLDGNAAFRHPEWAAYETDADERERRAAEAGINYVSLDGDIGVLGNGAGMVMSTLDLIAEAGGAAANFLDVGGGARIWGGGGGGPRPPPPPAALDLILADARVRALCVTIFGGITRCDEVAHALVNVLSAKGAAGAGLPVVVRLDGNGAAEGRDIVAQAALPGVQTAATVWQAVQAAVAAAAGAGAADGPGAPDGPGTAGT